MFGLAVLRRLGALVEAVVAQDMGHAKAVIGEHAGAAFRLGPAVGGKPGGEALSGLAQGFFYAGARALLVSHWPVESQSAVALMTDIFERRAADPSLTAAEAQRQAMLAMLDHPTWAHPAYWAPFILVGDPG